MRKQPWICRKQFRTWGAATLLSALLTFVACKSPHQYNASTPPDPKALVNALLGIDPAPESSSAPGRDDGAIARANTLKPIIYSGANAGAAGITMRTTFLESKKILSQKDLVGPIESDPDWAYDYAEGIVVYWKKQPPTTPDEVLVTTEYQGPLIVDDRANSPLPAELRSVHLGDSFQRYFDEDPTGNQLIMNLYRGLERTDASYDCLKEHECTITEPTNDDGWIFTFPRGTLEFGAQKHELKIVTLIPSIPRYDFGEPYDMVTGRFQTSEGWFGLGDTMATVLAHTKNVNVPTLRLPSFFTKSYSGISIQLTRSRFDAGYNEPDASERVHMVELNGNLGAQPFMIGSKFVKLTLSPRLKLELVDTQPGTAEDGSVTYLQYDVQIPPAQRAEFMQQLSALVAQALVNEAKATGQDIPLPIQHFTGGSFDDAQGRVLEAEVLAYFPARKKARWVDFRLDDATGSFLDIEAVDFNDPLVIRAIESLAKPVSPQDEALGGFHLGETVSISDIDPERQELTMTYDVGAPIGAVKNRVHYEPDVVVTRPSSAQKLQYRHEPSLTINVPGVDLELGIDGLTGEKHKIIRIALAAAGLKVSGLCGGDAPHSGVTAEFGQSARAFEAALAPVASREDGACVIRREKSDAASRLSIDYFVNEHVYVSFDRREINFLGVFTPVSGD